MNKCYWPWFAEYIQNKILQRISLRPMHYVLSYIIITIYTFEKICKDVPCSIAASSSWLVWSSFDCRPRGWLWGIITLIPSASPGDVHGSCYEAEDGPHDPQPHPPAQAGVSRQLWPPQWVIFRSEDAEHHDGGGDNGDWKSVSDTWNRYDYRLVKPYYV